MPEKLPPEFLAKLKSITAKRAKTVIDHILKHGKITTDELKSLYGYNHPPRAARDVREQGIPLVTTPVEGPDGRSISEYTFGDPNSVEVSKTGRTAFPKKFKDELLALYGSRCGICNATLEGRYLQIDHRVPYEVAGESAGLDPREFMLICGSCNRAKSWSCEHCVNWTEKKAVKVCQTCYWADPLYYAHIALRDIRRLDLVWSEAEVADFDRMRAVAEKAGATMPDFVKDVLGKAVRPKRK